MKKGLPLCHILFIKAKENAGALEEKGQHMRKTKKKKNLALMLAAGTKVLEQG